VVPVESKELSARTEATTPFRLFVKILTFLPPFEPLFVEVPHDPLTVTLTAKVYRSYEPCRPFHNDEVGADVSEGEDDLRPLLLAELPSSRISPFEVKWQIFLVVGSERLVKGFGHLFPFFSPPLLPFFP